MIGMLAVYKVKSTHTTSVQQAELFDLLDTLIRIVLAQ